MGVQGEKERWGLAGWVVVGSRNPKIYMASTPNPHSPPISLSSACRLGCEWCICWCRLNCQAPLRPRAPALPPHIPGGGGAGARSGGTRCDTPERPCEWHFLRPACPRPSASWPWRSCLRLRPRFGPVCVRACVRHTHTQTDTGTHTCLRLRPRFGPSPRSAASFFCLFDILPMASSRITSKHLHRPFLRWSEGGGKGGERERERESEKERESASETDTSPHLQKSFLSDQNCLSSFGTRARRSRSAGAMCACGCNGKVA
jgi:hypothetical protein